MNGYERLKELYNQDNFQNKPLTAIVNYLLQVPDMSEYYLRPEKNLKDLVNYLRDNAKEYCVNNISIIEDSQVYQWCIDYFQKTNAELRILLSSTNPKKDSKTELKSIPSNQMQFDFS